MHPCCYDGIHVLLEGEVGGGAKQVKFETKVRTVVKGTCGQTVEGQGIVVQLERYRQSLQEATQGRRCHLNDGDSSLHECSVKTRHES